MKKNIYRSLAIVFASSMILLALNLSGCKEDEPCTDVKDAAAGPDQVSCGSMVTLAGNQPSANESGLWEVVTGAGGEFDDDTKFNAVFTGTPGETYELQWKLFNGCNSSEDLVEIEIKGTLVANAGPDQQTCGASVTLTGNVAAGATGEWQIISGTGGELADASDAASVFSGQADETYVLEWKISKDGCEVSDQVTITFISVAIDAGLDQATMNQAHLSASAGNGVWSVVSGAGGEFSNVNDPEATFTGKNGTTYVLKWTVETGICTVSDEVQIELKRLKLIRNITEDEIDKEFFYDEEGRLTQITPYFGVADYSVTYSYGAGSKLESISKLYGDPNPILTVTESYIYDYDQNGRLNSVEYWVETQAGNSLIETYYYVYDQDEKLVAIDSQVPGGQLTPRPFTFGAEGRPTEYSLYSSIYKSVSWKDNSFGEDPNPERFADVGNPVAQFSNLIESWSGGVPTFQYEYEFDGTLLRTMTENVYQNVGGELVLTGSNTYEYEYE